MTEIIKRLTPIKTVPISIGDIDGQVDVVSRNGYCTQKVKSSGLLTVPELLSGMNCSCRDCSISTFRSKDLCLQVDRIHTRDILRAVCSDSSLDFCSLDILLQLVVTYHVCPYKILGPCRRVYVAMRPVVDRRGQSQILSLISNRGRLLLDTIVCPLHGKWEDFDPLLVQTLS